jgi:hypothetical protein
MQNTYFLGGASPAGFETSFWSEHSGYYGYYLKGGPGTGKSTLLKKIAVAFPDEPVSLYHCASDPQSLDAVVLETRGVYIADATAPHEAGTPLPCVTGELVDLGAGLDAELLQESAAEIKRCYQENCALHLQARKGFAGIAAMEAQTDAVGAAALDAEKLRRFAERLAGRLFPKRQTQPGVLLHRQRIAVTPKGRLAFLPPEHDLILLRDGIGTASAELLRLLAEAAAVRGLRCEVTQSLTLPDRPLVLICLPAQKLTIVMEHALPADAAAAPASVIRMQRFYSSETLRRQRTLLRFCRKTAEAAEARTSALLAEALQVHDELEAYYIRALQRPFLDQVTADLIEYIRARG